IVAEREGVAVAAVPFARQIRPLADLRALWVLAALVRRFRPAVVSAGTPKAGLLGIVAARLHSVPVRVYTVRGLRLETATGLERRLLTALERLAAASASHVVCVGESLRRRYLQLGFAEAAKTRVLLDGSSNGVDVERFRPARPGEAAELRRGLGIDEAAAVVGFVGRFTRDKGVEDLVAAFFDHVVSRLGEARLLLVGDYESGDPVAAVVRRRLEDPRVVRAGFAADTAPFYRAMDVLAFPSYREGFPNAPLEAAASGVAVVGYAATGTVDAVVDGATGLLVPVGDRQRLAAAILGYLEDTARRRRHGEAGRERVEGHFPSQRLWQAWSELYRNTLAAVEGDR
ncbi:MAG TPA: glycosyltransferase family 4 protein, partial [Thermoanaerobaculia bacterium]|nr:glycosyltransferase family 4 protein [Thermoanaerobaculia bacterium]